MRNGNGCFAAGIGIQYGNDQPFQARGNFNFIIPEGVFSFTQGAFTELFLHDPAGKLAEDLPAQVGFEIRQGIPGERVTRGLRFLKRVLCLGGTEQPLVIQVIAPESGVDRPVNELLGVTGQGGQKQK